MKKYQRSHNSVYVAIAGEVLNRRSMLLRNFMLNGQASASNALLHVDANRYGQVYETTKRRADKRTTVIELGHLDKVIGP